MTKRTTWCLAICASGAGCQGELHEARELIPDTPDRAADGPGCRPGINPGAPVWNAQVTLTAERATALAAVGVTSVRLDFRREAGWDDAALARYDEIVGNLEAAGLVVHGLVTYEAIAAGQYQWNDDPDGDGMNDAVTEFADTAAMMIGRYGDRIARWELWNEPNCYGAGTDDPQHAGCYYVLPRVLAHMVVETYLRVRDRIDGGSNELVLGGLLAQDVHGPLNTGADFLEQVYGDGVFAWLEQETGRRHPWNAIGIHPYVDQDRGSDGAQIHAVIDAIEAVMDAHGDGARLAVTEVGWSIAAVDDATQAANLETAYATLASRPRIDEIAWFAYQDAADAGLFFGLVDGAGNPRASHGAMRARVDACNQEGG